MDGRKMKGKAVTEEMLMGDGYRKYTGKDIDIFYNKEICVHSGNCVCGDSEVFEVGRRPWIIADNGSLDNNMGVINTCPSGALKYILKGGEQ